jgi:hypothetical protein
MSDLAPAVITRYLQAAGTDQLTVLADCFTPAGTVLDEGQIYTGRAEIIGWREELAGKFSYTSTVTGSTPIGDDAYRVKVRVEGNFPGGVADLTFDFGLADGLIAELRIVG